VKHLGLIGITHADPHRADASNHEGPIPRKHPDAGESGERFLPGKPRPG
jgi:hypothetical protein